MNPLLYTIRIKPLIQQEKKAIGLFCPYQSALMTIVLQLGYTSRRTYCWRYNADHRTYLQAITSLGKRTVRIDASVLFNKKDIPIAAAVNKPTQGIIKRLVPEAFLGHKSRKTAEVYSNVTKDQLQGIKTPIDDFAFNT